MKIVKFYFKYLLTTSNLMIFLIFTVFLGFSYYISINDLNISLSYNQILQYYFENSVYFTKILIVFLTSFLFMKLKGERNEYIINTIITAGYTKKQNYKGMINTNIIVVFVLIILEFVLYVVIGIVSKKYFFITNDNIIAFFNIFLLSILYGMITYLLIQLTNNQFVFIIVIVIFLLTELVNSNDNNVKYIFLYFFPNINSFNGRMYISNIFVIILIVILYVLNEYIYINKDLKN